MRRSLYTLMLAAGISFLTATCSFAGLTLGEKGWQYVEDDGSFVAGDWRLADDNLWYYFDENGQMMKGWVQINDKSYYLEPIGTYNGRQWLPSGAMWADAWTPDHYYVDASGAWVETPGKSRGIAAGSGTAAVTITEAEASQKILELMPLYPEGMHWDNVNRYKNGYGCAAYVFIVQDYVFGDSKSTIYKDFDWARIKAGDHIRLYSNTGELHSCIVLTKSDTEITITEGNYNYSIHWGRTYTPEELKAVYVYQEGRY